MIALVKHEITSIIFINTTKSIYQHIIVDDVTQLDVAHDVTIGINQSGDSIPWCFVHSNQYYLSSYLLKLMM